jgi:type I restriction enzyme S subunit
LTYDGTLDYLQMRAENRIGSFPQITFDHVKILELNVPDIPTQEKIVDVLSDIDSKIDINKRTISLLEKLSSELYNYWLVQFDFPDNQDLPYKSNNGPMKWDEDLKRHIPQDWHKGNLLDIASFQNGIACQKFPPTTPDVLKVIKIREMGEGFTENSDLVGSNVPSKILIHDGDILFSWSASLDVIIWAGGKGALNQHIFKVTSERYPTSFYYFELLNYLAHFKMMAENRKTTMGHITTEHLQQSLIVIPPLTVIEKLDELLKPNLEKIVCLKKEILRLSELKDWILPKLMNGQATIQT